MSSEAAQKAYPEDDFGGFHDFSHGELLEAFDMGAQHGAVEALRQAADTLMGKFDANPTDVLNRMADNWEAGK